MARLLLVRHGQSEWNAAGRWQGQADPPLSDLGAEQAQRAAGLLGGFDAIHASTLERAAATAAIISAELGIGPVLVDPRLVERHAGEWQGLTRDEIEATYPGWLAERRRPPGWEPDESVTSRAMAALEEIAGAHEGEVLVVAHGGVIYALEQMLGAEFARIGNLGGRWLHAEGGRWSLGERIHLLVDETVPDQI